MTRTYEKVRYLPRGKGDRLTPTSAAQGVEDAFRILEGRWKLLILFHLFGGKVLRFSELERAIPAISQKMLIQQLRQMEVDAIVRRIVHHVVPPRVEYCLTKWGQALCPSLDALLKSAAVREKLSGGRSYPHTDHLKHGAAADSRTRKIQKFKGIRVRQASI